MILETYNYFDCLHLNQNINAMPVILCIGMLYTEKVKMIMQIIIYLGNCSVGLTQAGSCSSQHALASRQCDSSLSCLCSALS